MMKKVIRVYVGTEDGIAFYRGVKVDVPTPVEQATLWDNIAVIFGGFIIGAAIIGGMLGTLWIGEMYLKLMGM